MTSYNTSGSSCEKSLITDREIEEAKEKAFFILDYLRGENPGEREDLRVNFIAAKMVERGYREMLIFIAKCGREDLADSGFATEIDRLLD